MIYKNLQMLINNCYLDKKGEFFLYFAKTKTAKQLKERRSGFGQNEWISNQLCPKTRSIFAGRIWRASVVSRPIVWQKSIYTIAIRDLIIDL